MSDRALPSRLGVEHDGFGRHAAWLKAYPNLGFDEIYLRHVGKELEEFIAAFGACILLELS